MKSFIGVGIGLLILACAPKQAGQKEGGQITIRGKIAFPQRGSVTIREFGEQGLGKPDSIRVTDGHFEKKILVKEPGYYQLNFYDQQAFNIILSRNDLEVNVDGNSMQGAVEIKGSPEHDLITMVQLILSTVQSSPQLGELTTTFNDAANAKDEARMETIRGQYMSILKIGTDSVAALLRRQPASLGVIEVLSQGNVLDADAYPDVYENAADKLKKEYPNSRIARDFISKVDKQKTTAIGREAPEIALPAPSGDTVRLSSLRGKFVLVDFWAKWCTPCRRENPNVVKAYHRFNARGFEVFGVSLDRTKEEWLQAIKEDGLVWTHVSDLKYFESQAARTYNIGAIPFSILLDTKGVIIAKNLRGAALEKKLEEVLGK